MKTIAELEAEQFGDNLKQAVRNAQFESKVMLEVKKQEREQTIAEYDLYGTRPATCATNPAWKRRMKFMELVSQADFEKAVLLENYTPGRFMPSDERIVAFYEKYYSA